MLFIIADLLVYHLKKFEGKTGDESGDEGMDYAPMSVTRDNTQIPDSDSDGEWFRLMFSIEDRWCFFADEAVKAETNLAVPEFEGVWDKHKAYKAPKDLVNVRQLPDLTPMERVRERRSKALSLFLFCFIQLSYIYMKAGKQAVANAN